MDVKILYCLGRYCKRREVVLTRMSVTATTVKKIHFCLFGTSFYSLRDLLPSTYRSSLRDSSGTMTTFSGVPVSTHPALKDIKAFKFEWGHPPRRSMSGSRSTVFPTRRGRGRDRRDPQGRRLHNTTSSPEPTTTITILVTIVIVVIIVDYTVRTTSHS